MRQLLWVGLGSGLGSAIRYALDLGGVALGLSGFPFATLAANLLGSLLIGYLARLWASGGAAAPHPDKWHFWMTGVCGGFTTFSAFSWQTLELIHKGQAQLAAFYAAGSVGLGLCALTLGMVWARPKTEST